MLCIRSLDYTLFCCFCDSVIEILCVCEYNQFSHLELWLDQNISVMVHISNPIRTMMEITLYWSWNFLTVNLKFDGADFGIISNLKWVIARGNNYLINLINLFFESTVQINTLLWRSRIHREYHLWLLSCLFGVMEITLRL